MRARYLTAKERAAAKRVASELIDRQAEDMQNRAFCLVFAAMLNAGLSVDQVNATIDEMVDVCAGYMEKKADNLADYALIQGLIDRGVNVQMTKEEL